MRLSSVLTGTIIIACFPPSFAVVFDAVSFSIHDILAIVLFRTLSHVGTVSSYSRLDDLNMKTDFSRVVSSARGVAGH